MRTYLIVGVTIAALVFLAILLLYTQSNLSPITQNPTPQASQLAPTVTTEPSKPLQRKVPQSDHIVMDGTGDFLSSVFELSEGIAVLELTHSNTGKFIITLLSSTPSNKVIIVNTEGEYTGVHAQPINSNTDHSPGIYELRIETAGHWRVDLKQTNWADGNELPLTVSGNGNWVSQPINIKSGTVKLDVTNQDSQEFSAYIIKYTGKIQHHFVSNTDNEDISEKTSIKDNDSQRLTPGVYVLAIKSDGNWDISLTQ